MPTDGAEAEELLELLAFAGMHEMIAIDPIAAKRKNFKVTSVVCGLSLSHRILHAFLSLTFGSLPSQD